MGLDHIRNEIEHMRRQILRQRKEIQSLPGISTAAAYALLQRMQDKVDGLCVERDRLVGESRRKYPAPARSSTGPPGKARLGGSASGGVSHASPTICARCFHFFDCEHSWQNSAASRLVQRRITRPAHLSEVGAALRMDHCSLPHILIVKPACAAQFLGVRLAVAKPTGRR
jgi:hypothetical protein